MTVLPLRLLGEAGLATVHAAAVAALAGWQRGYVGSAGADTVSAWTAAAPSTAAPAPMACWRDGERRLWLEHADDAAAMLAQRLFGDGAAGPIARKLAAGALVALGDALAAALLPATAAHPRAGSAAAPRVRTDSPAPADLAPGAGAAACSVRVGALNLRCILSGEAVEALQRRALAPPPAALPPLPQLAMREVLRDVPVRLTIEAGGAQVGAGSLLDCGPGDIVRLDTASNAPLKVLAPGGATVFYGFLGRVGEHSAVEVTRHF